MGETSRLIFTPKQSDLPFEASLDRRGNKVRQLRTSLREEEDNHRKVREAEAAGHGEEVRRDVAMNKALLRARGEKVHDNTSKIRKTQKFMEKKKAKGKEAWKIRVDTETANAKQKQEQRKENLLKRSKKKKGKLDSGGDGR